MRRHPPSAVKTKLIGMPRRRQAQDDEQAKNGEQGSQSSRGKAAPGDASVSSAPPTGVAYPRVRDVYSREPNEIHRHAHPQPVD